MMLFLRLQLLSPLLEAATGAGSGVPAARLCDHCGLIAAGAGTCSVAAGGVRVQARAASLGMSEAVLAHASSSDFDCSPVPWLDLTARRAGWKLADRDRDAAALQSGVVLEGVLSDPPVGPISMRSLAVLGPDLKLDVNSGEAGADVIGIDVAHRAQIAIPLAILVLGLVLFSAGWTHLGITAGYFGAQSGISLYMKLLLSDATISQELGIKGMPAAFLITSVQQIFAFACISALIPILAVTSWRIRSVQLTSLRQYALVLSLAFAFAANIGLNNFSLSLVAISLNLVIRSCLPLVTLSMQIIGGFFQPDAFPKVGMAEVILMLVGVSCAGVVTLSELQTTVDLHSSERLLLGVCLCVGSICAASLDLILGKILGKQVGLNALETTWYMSLPAALVLMPPAILLHHPADWPGYSQITDFQVLRKVFTLRPFALLLVLMSGVFSVSYNVLRYAMVQHLSATYTAFAGNFNKALTIMVSLMLGLERIPEGNWRHVMLLSIMGSILAFTLYGLMTAPKPGRAMLEVPTVEAVGMDRLSPKQAFYVKKGSSEKALLAKGPGAAA